MQILYNQYTTFNSPLEQFESVLVYNRMGCAWSYSFRDQIWVTLLFFFIVACYTIFMLTARSKPYRRYWAYLRSNLNLMLRVVKRNIKVQKLVFYVVLSTILVFIILSNITGMMPYTFTTTGGLTICSTLSVLIFVYLIFVGSYTNGVNCFSLLYPTGVSTFMIIGMALLELISFLARAISLAVRLFANMMSGHTLLKIVLIFSWCILLGLPWYYSLSPSLLLQAILSLETFIAVLQAIIFIFLFTLYLKELISLNINGTEG